MAAPRKPASADAEAKPKPKYSLAAFAAEATKEPFELDLGNGAPLVIGQPTEETMRTVARKIDEGGLSNWDILELIVGDQASVLNEAVMDKPDGTAERLGDALQEHFGWGNSQASPGS